MKKFLLLTTIITGLGLVPAFGQFGPHAGGPHFDGAMGKLFGGNQSFSATVEFQTAGPAGENMTIPGKLSFDGGKSRFEMHLSEMRGSAMPADAMEHMKAMGMDTMISVSRPDLKLIYLVYPGLNSYAEVAQADASSTNLADYKIDIAELGKETVDGHDCVKNKVTVTDKENNKLESTVWNAADLKNFPLKIETAAGGHPTTMLFKDLSFAKPAASTFEAPAGLTKYTDVQTMVQTEMMKKMGGGMAMPQH